MFGAPFGRRLLLGVGAIGMADTGVGAAKEDSTGVEEKADRLGLTGSAIEGI